MVRIEPGLPSSKVFTTTPWQPDSNQRRLDLNQQATTYDELASKKNLEFAHFDANCSSWVRKMLALNAPVSFCSIGHERLSGSGREIQLPSACFQLPAKRVRTLAAGDHIANKELGPLVVRRLGLNGLDRFVCFVRRNLFRALFFRHFSYFSNDRGMCKAVGDLLARVARMRIALHR